MVRHYESNNTHMSISSTPASCSQSPSNDMHSSSIYDSKSMTTSEPASASASASALPPSHSNFNSNSFKCKSPKLHRTSINHRSPSPKNKLLSATALLFKSSMVSSPSFLHHHGHSQQSATQDPSSIKHKSTSPKHLVNDKMNDDHMNNNNNSMKVDDEAECSKELHSSESSKSFFSSPLYTSSADTSLISYKETCNITPPPFISSAPPFNETSLFHNRNGSKFNMHNDGKLDTEILSSVRNLRPQQHPQFDSSLIEISDVDISSVRNIPAFSSIKAAHSLSPRFNTTTCSNVTKSSSDTPAMDSAATVHSTHLNVNSTLDDSTVLFVDPAVLGARHTVSNNHFFFFS